MTVIPSGLNESTRVLIQRLDAALAPMRQDTSAFPFAIASEDASFVYTFSKSQILEAVAAGDAAKRALGPGVTDGGRHKDATTGERNAPD